MPATTARVDAIFARATTRGTAPIVTATDVYRFAQSPFAAWADRHAPESEKDPISDFQRMLFERGREHEAAVVASLHPGAQRVAAGSVEARFRAGLSAMAAGTRAIHGAPALWRPLGMEGTFDLLERRDDAESVFGPWHYVVKEIKLARNIGDHHRLQAAFYHRALGHIQGYLPPEFFIVNADRVEAAFTMGASELDATLRAVRAIHDGLPVLPAYGKGAWPWETYTDRCAIERRDCTLVAGVGPSTRDRLAAIGVHTVEDLAAAPRERLVEVHGVGDKKAAGFQLSARALVERRPIPLERVDLPRVSIEVFLDLEGTPEQVGEDAVGDMDYLIGALVRRPLDGKEEYVSFVAHKPEKEGEMFHSFVAWLRKHDDYVLYHWSPYERTHLRRLAERHGLAPDMEAHLFSPMRDLLKDATRAYAFPTYGNSIKAIAPYLGFSWRHKSVNAMESIALYLEYAKDNEGKRDKLQLVLDYNEDDCIAMRVVKDFLSAHARPS